MASEVPPLNGRYELVTPARSTRRAVTWRARDTRLERDVMVTVLRPAAAADRALARRFAAGVTHAARVTHPNLVAILDWGMAGRRPYVVTEPLQGPTAANLSRVIGPLSAGAAVQLIAAAAAGLGAAHRAGMVHGRIAPMSLSTDRLGGVTVSGLGIAPVIEDGADAGPGRRLAALPFGAPEQLRGRPVLPTADVHALGAVLYLLLTGRPPWSPGPGGLVAGRLRRVPRPPSSLLPGVPAGLEAIVLRALAADPVQRFADGEAFAVALAAWAPATIDEEATTEATAVTRRPSPARLATYSAVRGRLPGSRKLARATLWLAAVMALGILGLGLLNPEAPRGSVLDATGTPTLAEPSATPLR